MQEILLHALTKIISSWERYTWTILSIRMNWNFSSSYETKPLLRRSMQEILLQAKILRLICRKRRKWPTMWSKLTWGTPNQEASWNHRYSYCWSDRRQRANFHSWGAILPCTLCSIAGLELIISKWFSQNLCTSLSADVATNSWLSSWLSHEDWCIACRRPMFQRYHLSGKTFGATSRSKERSGDDRTYPQCFPSNWRNDMKTWSVKTIIISSVSSHCSAR